MDDNTGKLCKYKDALGVPNEGVHRFKLGGVAVVDFAMTLVLALATSVATGVPWTLTTIFWILLAMFLHHIFCVRTSVNNFFRKN